MTRKEAISLFRRTVLPGIRKQEAKAERTEKRSAVNLQLRRDAWDEFRSMLIITRGEIGAGKWKCPF